MKRKEKSSCAHRVLNSHPPCFLIQYILIGPQRVQVYRALCVIVLQGQGWHRIEVCRKGQNIKLQHRSKEIGVEVINMCKLMYSLRTQTFFWPSLVLAETSDSQKYVCVRRLGDVGLGKFRIRTP